MARESSDIYSDGNGETEFMESDNSDELQNIINEISNNFRQITKIEMRATSNLHIDDQEEFERNSVLLALTISSNQLLSQAKSRIHVKAEEILRSFRLHERKPFHDL